ncbi:MAG: hypothetical protein K0S38_464 [Candidatus Paceibacter sp.]|jgi:DNA-directed RNA polymerase specialized sigma24 family protein|nr:hypothetical protein [Candidatus Paceibacter sp.]
MKAEFLKIYDRNADAIFRYCLRESHDRAVALAITDATFKKVWDYRMMGESVSSVESSLRSIASRLLRQHAEKKIAPKTEFKFS